MPEKVLGFWRCMIAKIKSRKLLLIVYYNYWSFLWWLSDLYEFDMVNIVIEMKG